MITLLATASTYVCMYIYTRHGYGLQPSRWSPQLVIAVIAAERRVLRAQFTALPDERENCVTVCARALSRSLAVVANITMNYYRYQDDVLLLLEMLIRARALIRGRAAKVEFRVRTRAAYGTASRESPSRAERRNFQKASPTVASIHEYLG